MRGPTQALRLLLRSGLRVTLLRKRLERQFGITIEGTGYNCRVVRSAFGKGCRIGEDAAVICSSLGDYTYIEYGCQAYYTTIGKYSSVGQYTLLGAAAHPSRSAVSTHPVFYANRPWLGYDFVRRDQRSDFTTTSIGNDVWIGAGVVVRDGVTIADGAIVGAGSVVTRDVEPYAVVGGTPARLIRRRFEPGVIDELVALRWWDHDEQWIREHAHTFLDITAFLERVRQ